VQRNGGLSMAIIKKKLRKKKSKQEMKCPECGERGGLIARKDAYADYTIFEDGSITYSDIAIFDNVDVVECQECGLEIDMKKIWKKGA